MHQLFSTALATGSLVLATRALAQTAAPAPTAPSGGGGATWIWVILILLVVAGAVWYFVSARRRASISHTTGIDSDRILGSAQQAKGSIKEGAGNLVGDPKLQAEGRADKIEGKIQNTLGGIKDTLRDK